MDFREYVNQLKSHPEYRGQVEHVEVIPRRSAVYAQTSEPLHPALGVRLREMGIDRLYTHQAAAVDATRRGEHVVVVAATASGKTLCYNLPTLDAVLANPKARALYLFPTKALAQDQLGKLNDFGLFPTVRFATFDGDTPQADRKYIKRGAHIVLSNPDMLHVGILPYHTTWASFLANLKYVVIDEIHTCRGVFGAHVAQVMRRLRRVCEYYGASPRFIACSATIANPGELMRNVTGLDATVIDNDGAPSGKRTFVFWNPPLLADKEGERRSAHMEAMELFTGLVENDVRTITFAKARKSAEIILKYARKSFENQGSDLGERVMSYRAGYTPEERRRIERGLFDGELIGVTATNALELGVDVGGLDATVLTGYPGTIASAWQQAGRSGRGRDEALSVMIALDNPLDQYLMRHPEYFFGRTSEQAVVDPHNRRILASHLCCAAYELPLQAGDLERFGPRAEGVVAQLVEEGALAQRNDRWYYKGDGYPAGLVNIRSASAETYQIRDLTRGGSAIGTVEGARVYQTLHPGAIYLHQGETYLVQRLDEEERTAAVVPTAANYYTEPREVTHITVLAEHNSRPLGATHAYFGEVVVSNQVLGYRCKQLYSDTILDIVDLDLPEQVFETEAFWFTVPASLVRQLAENGLDLCGAIHAAEHAAIGMMPLLATCDRWDIGGVSSPNHMDTGMATVFIYDGYPGGVGISEATYHRLAELLGTTQEMIASCPCLDGCPSCVQSPKCGNNNEPLDKRGAAYLLEKLLYPEPAAQPAPIGS
jgi:DEAD/DEAH box helicase domain-containing protein